MTRPTDVELILAIIAVVAFTVAAMNAFGIII
jgi:hypothetical protein